ncbi:MAG: M48 family metallopeptidase [Candidatus Omnitrophica bacterium]|nr:M48 family metallopeptidase [Candidatus Omnitrophota bacterium]
MWEIIAANKRRSVLLIAGMGAILLGFGWVAGELFGGPGAGIVGCGLAGGLWLILTAVSYFQGESMLLKSSRAHQITPEVHPELFNIVEEMKIAASLPAMPRIYVIDDPGMNAFATGTSPDKSSIAVTAGLLTALNRDELQGVIAHETSHILNRDILYMTLAGVMLGSMQILGQFVTRGLWYGGASGSGRRYRSSRNSSGSGGGSQGLLIAAALIFAILGPILAQLFYFSLSRKREYLADASGARLTRYPEGLASALEKISGRASVASANGATAPMFIEKPEAMRARSHGSASSLLATHPPIEKRVAILRTMMSSGYVGYSNAARAVLGGKDLLPKSALQESDTPVRSTPVTVPVGLGRLATPVEPPLTRSIPRPTGDLMRAVNHFTFLNCACGLKIKLPPEFSHSHIQCPKCSTSLPVRGQSVTPSAAGWRTVSCAGCGKALNLSPAFSSPYIICRFCGGRTTL